MGVILRGDTIWLVRFLTRKVVYRKSHWVECVCAHFQFGAERRIRKAYPANSFTFEIRVALTPHKPPQR